MNIIGNLLLAYLIIAILVLWFITIRYIVVNFHKRIKDSTSKNVANQNKDTDCDYEPKPERVSKPEIVNLGDSPSKQRNPDNSDKPPILSLHSGDIINDLPTKSKQNQTGQ